MSGSKPYPQYKRSGLASPPEIPIHWRVDKMRRLTTMTVGWTPPTGDDAAFIGENLWANISDLGPRTVTETAKRISDEAVRASRIQRSPKGSLLFSFKLSVGLVSFAGAEMYTNEAIATFLGSKDLDLRYAFYAFSPFLLENATENIYGAKILNQERIFATRLALPDVAEQRIIADYLDRETAEIDAFIADQEELVELLGERRLSTISNAVIRGLDPTGPVVETGLEWPAEVPASWQRRSIRNVFRVLDCKHVTAEFHDDGEYPLASIREVKGDYVDLANAKRTTRSSFSALVEGGRAPIPGDLIISRNASVGEVAMVPPGLGEFAMGQDVSLIRDPLQAGRTRFLAYVLKSKIGADAFAAASIGSTFKRINVDDIKALLFWMPPTNLEMEAISDYLDSETRELDQAIADAREAITLSRERRAALISAAVTGKIDVRDAA